MYCTPILKECRYYIMILSCHPGQGVGGVEEEGAWPTGHRPTLEQSVEAKITNAPILTGYLFQVILDE